MSYKRVYDYNDECVYEGEMENGMKNGYGTEYTYEDVQYEDEYDRMQTRREISTKYEGHFKNGDRHGDGILHVYNYVSGCGTIDSDSSYVKEGTWSYGNFSGSTYSLAEKWRREREQDYEDNKDDYKGAW